VPASHCDVSPSLIAVFTEQPCNFNPLSDDKDEEINNDLTNNNTEHSHDENWTSMCVLPQEKY
jgi:hypothetical protein